MIRKNSWLRYCIPVGVLVIITGSPISCGGPQSTPAQVDFPAIVDTYDWRDAVEYRITVDRFVDGNISNNVPATSGIETSADFMGGDFVGITQKLQAGYFSDLGVNVLVLSSPFKSTAEGRLHMSATLKSAAFLGDRPIDLGSIDPRLGSRSELAALVTAAHDRSVKVLVSLPVRQIDDSSALFIDHPDWFWGVDKILGSSDMAWDSPEAYKGKTEEHLWPLNIGKASAFVYIADALAALVVDTGIDGYSIEDASIADPLFIPALRKHFNNTLDHERGVHTHIEVQNSIANSIGDAGTALAGLGALVDPSSKADAATDLVAASAIRGALLARNIDMVALDSYLALRSSSYLAGTLTAALTPTLSRPIRAGLETPDDLGTPWSSPSSSPDTTAHERLRMALCLLYCLPGTPALTFGDEYGQDGYGFPDYYRIPHFDSALSSDESVTLGLAKQSAAARGDHPALRKGAYASLGHSADTLAFSMSLGTDVVYVLLNRGGMAATVGEIPTGNYADLLGGSDVSGPDPTVAARSVVVLIRR